MPTPDSATPNGEHVPDDRVWHSLLHEFRTLGGIADNVVLRPSSTGRGLFPEDPAQPVRLRVPDNLLFRPREIELHGDNIRIEDKAEKAQPVRVFFEHYEGALSWGAGGRTEGATLVDLFDALPPELQNRLAADFGMGAFIEGERRERILRYFLRSRAIRRHGEPLLAPFFDRMNRGAKGLPARPGPAGGIQIEGRAEGEVLLAWEQFDSLDIFKRQGIAVQRAHAFSLPMRAKASPFDLVIGRDLSAHRQRQGFQTPQMRTESGTVHLSYLTVGNASFPRMPRGIFYALMREARAPRAEDIFDRILFVNRAKFLSLLGALEPLRGDLVSRLRGMAHVQLAALAECTGARAF